MVLFNILRPLTRFFLTTPCPICHRPTAEILCISCYRQLLACRGGVEFQVDTPTSGKQSCPDDAELSIFSWGQYRGVLKQALTLLKYGGQAELGVWLGYQMGKHWRASGHIHSHKTVVIPIPLHQQRLQQRGYNQAALIAKGFCRVTGYSSVEHGLIRTKTTKAMHSLGAKERQANLMEAFELGANLPSTLRPILLIDDIYTTGTTARSVGGVLRNAGYTVTGIAAVARTVFRHPSVDVPKH